LPDRPILRRWRELATVSITPRQTLAAREAPLPDCTPSRPQECLMRTGSPSRKFRTSTVLIATAALLATSVTTADASPRPGCAVARSSAATSTSRPVRSGRVRRSTSPSL